MTNTLNFLTDDEVPSGKANVYSNSHMSRIFFARNDDQYVRCIASFEVIMDQYQDEAENPRPETIEDLKDRFIKLANMGVYSRPSDDFEGIDIILTTENFASSRLV